MKPDRRRVILYTNTLVGGLVIPGSVPDKAIRKALDECDVFVSDETLDELQRVLFRPKFDRYFQAGDTVRERFTVFYAARATRIDVNEHITECRDPKDNKFLEVAVAASADVLVSGDGKDLLKMNPFRGIRICNAGEFVKG